MNNLCTDIGYISLNKFGEQLCGDRVEIVDRAKTPAVIWCWPTGWAAA